MVNGVKKRKRTRTGEKCKLNCEEWIIYTTEKQAAEGSGAGAGVTWEIVELTTHATNKRQAPHFEGTAVKALDKGTMGSSSWRRSSSLLLSTATDWVKDERQGGGTSKTAHRYALWMGLPLPLPLWFSFFNCGSVSACSYPYQLLKAHSQHFLFSPDKSPNGIQSIWPGAGRRRRRSVQHKSPSWRRLLFFCFCCFLGNAASLGQWQRAKAGNTCSCARKTYRKRCDKR